MRMSHQVRIPVRVIFRIDRRRTDAEVTAVFDDREEFPSLTCYAHMGQHGTCSRDWAFGSTQRAATPAEYAPLLAELTTRGYDVTVGKRLSQWLR